MLFAEPLNAKTRLANEDYKTGSSLKIDCLTNQNSNITWFFNNEPIETSNHLNSLARRSPKYAVIKNADNSISIETLIRQHSGILFYFFYISFSLMIRVLSHSKIG